jgi:hypothetical protein
MSTARWYVCEAPLFRSNGGFCLYTDRAAAKMEERLGLARCIKHGTLLGYDPTLDGKTRAAARRQAARMAAPHVIGLR